MKLPLNRPLRAGATLTALTITTATALATLTLPRVAEAVEFSVREGEDLLGALKRLRPCLRTDAVLITPEVLATNPERADPQGRMVLRNARLKLPNSFVNPRVSCDAATATSTSTSTAEASALAAPALLPSNSPPLAESHEPPVTAPLSEKADGVDDKEHTDEHAAENSGLKNKLSISGTLTYARLDAALSAPPTSQTSHLSNQQPGFEIEYERELSEKWAVAFTYGYTNTSYQDLDGVSFVEPTVSLHELGATLIRTLAEGTRLGFLVGLEQVDELSVDQYTTQIIDHTFRPVAGFRLLRELGQVGGVAFGVNLGAQAFLPTTSTQQVGLGEHVAFEVGRDLTHRWSIGLSGGLFLERQATAAESHSLTYLKGSFGLGYRF